MSLSITGQILDSPPAAQCSPAGHHYPSWSSLKDLHISQAFFNHYVLFTAAIVNL